MKPSIPILSTLVLILFAACSTPRMATSTEYDDIYYSSSDRTTPAVSSVDRQDQNQTDDVPTYRRNNSYDSYNDAYYDEDDFYHSRRLRRFHSNSSSSWRYYDPFYSNDLYYVMGTPHWSRWNNNGWYNWNRPRFGASFGWGSPFYASPWGYGSMNNFGYWNSFNYYNPWVNTYYGYDPFFGYNGFGPALGYGGGFNNFGYGYYGGFGYGSAYYCPPGGYGGFASSIPAYQRYNTQHRNSARTTSSQSSFTPNNTRVRESGMNAPGSVSTPTTVTQNGAAVSRNNRYLSPRPQTELVEARRNISTSPAVSRPGRSTTTSPATTPGTQTRPNVYTRPDRSTSPSIQQRETRPGTQTQPNVYTRPGRTETPSRATPQPDRRNYSAPAPSRNDNYSAPSRSTTPSRNASPSYSPPSRSSSPSYSPPSRSSSPSYSPPSRSSSPSSGGSSSGGRRN